MSDWIDMTDRSASPTRALLESILTEDPNDMAADAVTVLDVWRKEAAGLLGTSTPTPRMPEREEVIDAIVEEVQREVRRSIGERASTTDILRDVLRRRLSPPAEAQEIEALREQMICGTCGGLPHASAKPCVCTIEGPKGTIFGEVAGVRRELFAAAQEIERLRAENERLTREREDRPDVMERVRTMSSEPVGCSLLPTVHLPAPQEDRNGR